MTSRRPPRPRGGEETLFALHTVPVGERFGTACRSVDLAGATNGSDHLSQRRSDRRPPCGRGNTGASLGRGSGPARDFTINAIAS